MHSNVFYVLYIVYSLCFHVCTKFASFITAHRSRCCIVFGVSLCLSVRPLKIIDFMSTGPLDLVRVHFEWNHECLFVCLSVSPDVCPGLLATHNHFQTLRGHARHHMDQFLSLPLSSSPYEGPDRHFFREHKFLIVDISDTSCRIVTKFCTVMGLANGNLFPEFGELYVHWAFGSL